MNPYQTFTRLSLLAFGLLVPLLGGAALHFDSEFITVRAEPGAKQVVVSFSFENKGEHPVEILQTNTSCGCTAAELKQRLYAPGERGELEAIFTVGSRKGVNREYLNVQTSSAENPRHHLAMEIVIPELVSIEGRLLIWRIGEEPAPKSLPIVVSHDDPIHVADVIVRSNAGFAVEMREIEEGRRYELVVTPESTETRRVGSAVIVMDFPADNPLRFPVNLRIF